MTRYNTWIKNFIFEHENPDAYPRPLAVDLGLKAKAGPLGFIKAKLESKKAGSEPSGLSSQRLVSRH